MSETKFFISGDKVHVNGKVYFKSNLEREHPKNLIGLSRLDKRTGKYESYNPHRDGPFK